MNLLVCVCETRAIGGAAVSASRPSKFKFQGGVSLLSLRPIFSGISLRPDGKEVSEGVQFEAYYRGNAALADANAALMKEVNELKRVVAMLVGRGSEARPASKAAKKEKAKRREAKGHVLFCLPEFERFSGECLENIR